MITKMTALLAERLSDPISVELLGCPAHCTRRSGLGGGGGGGWAAGECISAVYGRLRQQSGVTLVGSGGAVKPLQA